MPDSLKKQIRARMMKTGESHQKAQQSILARRALDLPAPSLPVPSDRSVEELLALLQTPSTFGVLVGRVPSVASGANPVLVQKQAEDLARNPRYYAKTGGTDMLVSLEEHNRLIAVGAIDDRKGQILRSHRFVEAPFEGLTFSEQCKKCRRWIWCGEENRESTCICGHPYRVSFDLIAELVWGKEQYQRCMDCGAEFAMHPVSEGYSPWRPVSMWQVQCNKCHQVDDGPTGPAAIADPEDDFVVDFVQPTEPPRFQPSALNASYGRRRRRRAV